MYFCKDNQKTLSIKNVKVFLVRLAVKKSLKNKDSY